MTSRTPSPESQLPLPAATFHILMALADEDRHGYAIIQEVSARTSGEVRLGAGTLYRSLQRMAEQDLVTELGWRERAALFADERSGAGGSARATRPGGVQGSPPEKDDARRRYYRLTPFGRAVAEAETRRLGELLRLARASGFVPRKA
jgi:DNA-binding PadR family transcriptional regulator